MFCLRRACRQSHVYTPELTVDVKQLSGGSSKLLPVLYPEVLAARLNSIDPHTHKTLRSIMELVLQTRRRRFRQWLTQVTQLGDVELGLSCDPPGWTRSVFIPIPQKKAKPKNAQTTMQLHSFHMLVRQCSKSFKLGFNSELRIAKCTSWI